MVIVVMMNMVRAIFMVLINGMVLGIAIVIVNCAVDCDYSDNIGNIDKSIVSGEHGDHLQRL